MFFNLFIINFGFAFLLYMIVIHNNQDGRPFEKLKELQKKEEILNDPEAEKLMHNVINKTMCNQMYGRMILILICITPILNIILSVKFLREKHKEIK